MTYDERRVAGEKRAPSSSFLKPAVTAALIGFSGTSMLAPTPAAAQSYAFSSVQIEGLNAIEASTVMSYLGFGRGETVSAAELNDAYKRLAGSGLFADVTVVPRGSTLVVKVQEFPLISRINIEGNRRLKDDQLLAMLQSKPRYVYNPEVAAQDAETIAQAYADQGRLAATVKPVIIRRPNNRVDLVFEVSEGKNSEIERLNFTGNRAFSDSRLRRVIASKQAGLLRFLISADTFDPARVEFDKKLLKDFYASRGYIDMDVVAVTSRVTPQQDGYFVSYEIREGQKFSFGQLDAVSEVEGIDAAAFRSMINLRPGTAYNPALVDRVSQRMEKRLGDMGYDFVRVDPRITRNDRDGTLDITFAIVKGPRVVVERIDIEGNTTTLDRVVRQQFTTVEGDPFNPREIRAAAERIRALGYFSNVDVQSRQGTAPDNVIIDVNVEEQGTGSFAIGGTYALGLGIGLSASFSDTNFLGRGQYFSLRASAGVGVRNYSFAFAEPFLFGQDLRLGINANYNTTSWQSGLFDTWSANLQPSLEFPASETLRLRGYAGVSGANIMNYTGGSRTMLAEQARGRQIGGLVGAGFSYDSRRTGLDSSTFYVGRGAVEVGGLGADGQYVKATGLVNVTSLVFHETVTLSATVEGGAIQPVAGAGTRITDRFMMSPDQVLGFAPYGMGPRDRAGVALGGNYYAAGRLEAKFPLGLPEEYGINGGLFAMAGSVWGLDSSPAWVDDTMHLRASVGAAIHWDTPIGPLRFSYAFPVMKQSSDVVQNFGLSLSTSF
ncbi:MAG: outer membrane protein assembly factor BamA [Alphaproteobacteria bacterium]|nr:MAG: outer membrane protein assembly factor BamA [Alphaproteobacteria bacterium]